jgi:hypothetical protein
LQNGWKTSAGLMPTTNEDNFTLPICSKVSDDKVGVASEIFGVVDVGILAIKSGTPDC